MALVRSLYSKAQGVDSVDVKSGGGGGDFTTAVSDVVTMTGGTLTDEIGNALDSVLRFLLHPISLTAFTAVFTVSAWYGIMTVVQSLT